MKKLILIVGILLVMVTVVYPSHCYLEDEIEYGGETLCVYNCSGRRVIISTNRGYCDYSCNIYSE